MVEMTKSDVVLVAGDFGGVWYGDRRDKIKLAILEDLPSTVAFTDGNHENLDALAKYPVEEWNGSKIQFIRPHVIHLMRRQVYTLEERTFFTMGEASSHDISDGILDPNAPDFWEKYTRLLAEGRCRFRVLGVSWWPEELPSEEKYAEARWNLDAHSWAVDYIITHSPPSGLLPALGNYQSDQLTDFLEEVRQRTKYYYWLFGHCYGELTLNEKHRLLYSESCG